MDLRRGNNLHGLMGRRTPCLTREGSTTDQNDVVNTDEMQTQISQALLHFMSGVKREFEITSETGLQFWSGIFAIF